MSVTNRECVVGSPAVIRRSQGITGERSYRLVELRFGDVTGALDDNPGIGGEQPIRANATALI
jgi:hypothetical protein